MLRSPEFRFHVFALAAVVSLAGCGDTPSAPDVALNAFGRDGGTVTVPVEIQWGEGSFVVVPFDDSRVPAGTSTADCPVGDANPDLGIPAGFPNGGGFVISQGDGEGNHFGHLTSFSTRCAVQFFPATDPPFVNFDLRSTLTAADGDQLFGRAPYARTPFTPAGVPAQRLEIVGGTGRFEGASGWLSPSQGTEITCTDDSGFCLEGTWEGGFVEGELTLPRP